MVTPHEYNEFIAEETDLKLLEPYYTDLKTFRKVTWLKEASPEYVQWELPGSYIFEAYTKFYKTKEEREAMLKEKIDNQTIEEPAVNTDNIDTEEERKERCKDEAMKQFNEIIKITGLIVTKLDGTAKGGVLFAVEEELNAPVKFIGVGEKMEDLMPFEPEKFLEALFADETDKKKESDYKVVK